VDATHRLFNMGNDEKIGDIYFMDECLGIRLGPRGPGPGTFHKESVAEPIKVPQYQKITDCAHKKATILASPQKSSFHSIILSFNLRA
jgi:hypothetical protein